MIDKNWPVDMQPTGNSYAGFRNGRCVAVSMQFCGKRGLKNNADALKDYAKRGYDIQTLSHEEAANLLSTEIKCRKLESGTAVQDSLDD